MNPENQSIEINDKVKEACAIANGSAPAPNDEGRKIRAASKEYSARGSRRHHWFRMVLRNGAWTYFSEDRLPSKNFLASERNATVYGMVFAGELVCQHDLGGPVDVAYLITDQEKSLVSCEFSKIRSGELKITLPDGGAVTTPNPRK